MMEKNIQQLAKEAVQHPRISGFLCTDSQGLCLAAEGLANEKSSGIIATIAALAAKLEPHGSKSPVICIESDSTKILIQSKDEITTAIYKNISPGGGGGGGGILGGGSPNPHGIISAAGSHASHLQQPQPTSQYGFGGGMEAGSSN